MRKREVIAVGCFLLAACSSDPRESENSGVVQLELNRVPENVHCVRISAANQQRSVLRSIDTTPGQASSAELSALPTGLVSFGAEAFSKACSLVDEEDTPTWLSEAVLLSLLPGVATKLQLTLRPNGVVELAPIEWEPDVEWRKQASTLARGYMGSGYDAEHDRLILFGGYLAPNTLPNNDVLVVMNASGVAGTPSFVELKPSGELPHARSSGAVVYDPLRNRLLVHGGCAANCSPALADTWVLDNANGLGGESRWSRLSDAPLARAEFTGAFDAANRRLIVYGGDQAFKGGARNDVWVMSEDATGKTVWTELHPQGVAPKRVLASVAYDPIDNRLIVFGGDNGESLANEQTFSDVWLLTHANGLGGTPEWIQLAATGTLPNGRNAAGATYDAASRCLLVFGGINVEAGITTTLGDMWMLSNANGLGGSSQWIQIQTDGPSPVPRYGLSAAYNPKADRLIVAFGNSVGVSPEPDGLRNDLWTLSGAASLK